MRVALCCAAGLGLPARAAPLDDWRAEAVRVRVLADNDVPAALEGAARLQAQLPAEALPADRALALNVLARAEIYAGENQRSATHTQQAMDIAKAAGDRVGQAEADLNTALNSVNLGRVDQLVAATTHSLTVLEGVARPDLLAEALLRTSMMYRRLGQLEESVTMAMQSMQIARQSTDPWVRAYAHQGLGISFAQSFRYAEAREHFQAMLTDARAAGSRLLVASALQGLGEIASGDGDRAGGERLMRESLQLYRQLGGPLHIAHGQFSLAAILRQQGRLAEALALLNEAEAIYRRVGQPNRIGLWYTMNAQSEVHQLMGELPTAIERAREAHKIAQDIGFSQYVADSAQRLAALEAARGDFRRAYDFTQEAAQLRSRAERESSSSRMLELTRRYEAGAQQHAIDELKYRNARQTAELQQRELQQRWLWTLLGTVVVVLTGVAWFLLRLRRSQEAIRALNAGLEQRVAEATAEMHEQASYLRTLIDTLPLMVWLKDTEGRYLAVNQATAEACGRTAEQMVGRLDNDLWPPEVADRLRANDAKVLSGGTRQSFEAALSMRSHAGWYEVHKAPVTDGRSIIGLVGAALDVNERRAAEQARETALAEARRLAQQRSEFLAQMSHELRTPLNGILGFAQILQRDKPLSERQARGLGIIHESGQHLLTLINDILDLARIDAAKLELNPAEVDLRGLLAVVADIVRVKAEEKHVLFLAELDDGLPPAVRVDEKRLRQVLLNLLSNAVKFTDRGRICLRVNKIEATSQRARIRFEVEDSGIGMSDEQLARLFQPFEQVSDAAHREGGTGLGLTISRQLVRLMGGDIEVSSLPGRGSCFWFDIELPLVDARAAPVRPLGPPIGYQGRRRHILVADDAAQNRAVLVDGLALLGFEMHEATDGAAAVERAQAVQPDLIVMDILMPVMDGLEATRRIHAIPGLAGVPVIAASGNAAREIALQCTQAGASDFLTKPIDQEALLAAIGRLLALEWIREEAPPPPEDTHWDDAAAPVLPPHELDELHRLAKAGNMRRICEQADRIEQDDPRFVPLARHLRSLAQGCQTKALRDCVDALKRTPNTSTL